jgi:hypothetical protein
MITVLVALALAGGGLWLVFHARSDGGVKFGVTLCALALATIGLGIMGSLHDGQASRCRALGGIPVDTGRAFTINCSDQHGGFIDPARWR